MITKELTASVELLLAEYKQRKNIPSPELLPDIANYWYSKGLLDGISSPAPVEVANILQKELIKELE